MYVKSYTFVVFCMIINLILIWLIWLWIIMVLWNISIYNGIQLNLETRFQKRKRLQIHL
jgi:hypothetical protein